MTRASSYARLQIKKQGGNSVKLKNVIGVAGGPGTGKSTLVGMVEDLRPDIEIIQADNYVREFLEDPNLEVADRFKSKFKDTDSDFRNPNGAISIGKLTRTPDRLQEFLRILHDPMTERLFEKVKGSPEETKMIDWLFLPTLKEIWPELGLSVVTFVDFKEQVDRYYKREVANGKPYTREFAERHVRTHAIDYESVQCDMPVKNDSVVNLERAAQKIARFNVSGLKMTESGIYLFDDKEGQNGGLTN